MAHESFEDPATAAVMNELFVNIKVDREERPDIDQIYMSALHHLGEQGGWPLTMFLTPAGEPVWGGTYFPKTSRYGKPAFTDVLHEVARLFRDEPAKIQQNRDALMERLAERARPAGRVTIGVKELDQIAQQIGGAFDPVNGGLRGAPKFPNAAMYELVWRAGLRSGDERFFKLIEHTLERISEGGIYDHLGGGYSRYSVDEQVAGAAFREDALRQRAAARAAAAGPCAHRQPAVPPAGARDGHLAGAGDDRSGSVHSARRSTPISEGEEGKFYVWSRAEIDAELGEDDAAFFATHYDVTEAGNFEGHNILNRLQRVPRSAEDETRLIRHCAAS